MSLTPDQQNELTACFQTFDSDADGTLSPQECAMAMRSLGACLLCFCLCFCTLPAFHLIDFVLAQINRALKMLILVHARGASHILLCASATALAIFFFSFFSSLSLSPLLLGLQACAKKKVSIGVVDCSGYDLPDNQMGQCNLQQFMGLAQQNIVVTDRSGMFFSILLFKLFDFCFVFCLILFDYFYVNVHLLLFFLKTIQNKTFFFLFF